MKEEIEKLIKKVLENLDIEEVVFVVEHPEDLKMGDYSTNVAMTLAKSLKVNPKELAEKIVAEMSRMPLDSIQEIQVAGAGFINFYLSKEFFVGITKEILKNY